MHIFIVEISQKANIIAVPIELCSINKNTLKNYASGNK